MSSVWSSAVSDCAHVDFDVYGVDVDGTVCCSV